MQQLILWGKIHFIAFFFFNSYINKKRNFVQIHTKCMWVCFAEFNYCEDKGGTLKKRYSVCLFAYEDHLLFCKIP